jgi:hypothetical protein
MKEFVSNRWVSVTGLAAATSVICVIFIPDAFPWTAFAWVALVVGVALWLGRSSGSARSMADVIGDVEAEPARVTLPLPRPGQK